MLQDAVLYISPEALECRSTVGLPTLDRPIGVRIPVPQLRRNLVRFLLFCVLKHVVLTLPYALPLNVYHVFPIIALAQCLHNLSVFFYVKSSHFWTFREQNCTWQKP